MRETDKDRAGHRDRTKIVKPDGKIPSAIMFTSKVFNLDVGSLVSVKPHCAFSN